MLVIYKERRVSYDHDWRDAFTDYLGATCTNEPTVDAIKNADIVVTLHSMCSDKGVRNFPEWIMRALMERRGKLVWFLDNEFRDFDEKNYLCDRANADFVASMLPLDSARRMYGRRTISLPHALNEKVFRTLTPRKDREFALGYRGTRSPWNLGDNARNRIVAMAAKVPGADVEETRPFDRQGWAERLNKWRATVATESGKPCLKVISSRHFDAIGTKTVQIMSNGYYNGILSQDDYILCDLDGSLDEPLRRAEDEGDAIAERALDHVLENHTYRHRMADFERACS